METFQMLAALLFFRTSAIRCRVDAIPFCGYKSDTVAHQPAIPYRTIELSENKLPTMSFALILPVAMIIKILFDQVLFAILN